MSLELIDECRRRGRRITLGADKAYDVTQFVHDLRDRSVTPHIAIDGHLTKTGKRRKTAVDGRTTHHAGYDISQRCRKRIEEVFGWNGNDEMDEASGDGWAELQPNGSLEGQICFHGGDEANFTARPWKTSSTAC